MATVHRPSVPQHLCLSFKARLMCSLPVIRDLDPSNKIHKDVAQLSSEHWNPLIPLVVGHGHHVTDSPATWMKEGDFPKGRRRDCYQKEMGQYAEKVQTIYIH